MFRHILALGLLASAFAATTPSVSQAQYYYRGPTYDYDYGPPPPRYYRPPPPSYYGQPPGYGYGYGYRYGPPPPPDAIVRIGPGDNGAQPWRPRVDPRTGTLYCVQASYTVQDGICKPGRYY